MLSTKTILGFQAVVAGATFRTWILPGELSLGILGTPTMSLPQMGSTKKGYGSETRQILVCIHT